MEIYVLKDGKRQGPFLPFKIRELLEDKELQPGDPGWMEGMEQWAPLSSIEALENWMPRDPALPPPLPDPEVAQRRQAALNEVSAGAVEARERRFHAVWRWLARTADEMLWFALIWLAGLGGGWLDLWDFLIRHPYLLFGPAVVWIPVEAWLLSRFTTTPGKWLMGIRVTDDLGQPLSYQAALKRSTLVMLMGNGLGMPNLSLLPVLQSALSWVLFRQSGTTFWDRQAGSALVYTRPVAAGYPSVGAMAMVWLAIGMWITLTAPIPPDLSSEERAPIDEMRQKLQESMQQLNNRPGTGDRQRS